MYIKIFQREQKQNKQKMYLNSETASEYIDNVKASDIECLTPLSTMRQKGF